MKIRSIKTTDYHKLEDFLYLAVHQQDPHNLIPRSVVDVPEIRNYIEGFGTQKDDHGLVAVIDDRVVGMVWVRLLVAPIRGYGNVDNETPEFAISIKEEYRGQGIGRALMNAMFALMIQKGYKKTSLSVQKTNRAANLYKSLGFETIKESDEEFIMVKQFLSNQ